MNDLIHVLRRSAWVVTALLLFLSLPLDQARAAESAPQIHWLHQYGTTGDDSGNGSATNTRTSGEDPEYNYTVGTVSGTLPGQTSAGGTDAYIRKYDMHGNLVWERQFGTSDDDRGTAISVNQNGEMIYVLGTTNGTFEGETNAGGIDGFLRLYDKQGTLLWTKQFGTDGTDEFDSLVASNARIAVGGRTSGSMAGAPNAGGFDALVVGFNLDGIFSWVDEFGSSADDGKAVVTCAPDGFETYSAASVVSPLPGTTGYGGSDIVVRKYVNWGDLVWTRVIGTPDNDDSAVIGTYTSSVIVAARTDGAFPGTPSSGGTDVIAARYEQDGTMSWSTQFGSSGDDHPIAEVFGGSSAYITGTTTGTFPGEVSSGGTDAFIAKVGPVGGARLWVKQLGTAGTDSLSGIGLGSSNFFDPSSYEVFGVGETTGTFSGETSAGGTDAYAVRLMQDEDGDFVFNTLDALPFNYTDEFSDGVTTGFIVDRGGQTLVVADPDTEGAGVAVEANNGGTTDPAEVSICGDTARADLDAGDAMNVKCGSAIISVTQGEVDTGFKAPDGNFAATSTFGAGNTLRFAVESNEFTTPDTNVSPITLSIGSTDHTLNPGTLLTVVNAAADTFLRGGAENRNEGANPELVVRKQGDIRSLVRFDLSGISLTGLQKATLVLTVDGSNAPDNWGKNGQLIDVRRLTQAWTEGNGKELDVPEAEATYGNGPGATWKCSTDTDISNKQKNCSQEWDGADTAIAPRTAAGFLMKNNYTGQAVWDVTQDLQNGATNGWMIVRREEGKSGNVRFYSREGAAGNENLMPQLVLEYENP